MDHGRLAINPAARIKGIKVGDQTEPRWLTRTEQNRLLSALDRAVQLAESRAVEPSSGLSVQAIRDRALIVLLLNTGLRVQETVQLTLPDLTLNGKYSAINDNRKNF